jgi:MYXO-CTERM domain-containing protein
VKTNTKQKEQRAMNSPNEDRKPVDNMELLKQQPATCGPGCNCHATGKSGKTRWVIGAIVLAAAGVMVVRAMITNNRTSSQPSAPAFPALATVVPVAETSIGSLAELNSTATNSDVVFIFLPDKEGTYGHPPSTAMNGAARTIESKTGFKCGLFILKPGSSNYDQIAGQFSLPGVLAMVKGHGMSAISGDITEAKLVEGFVSASGGACCGSSAGPGCCPK